VTDVVSLNRDEQELMKVASSLETSSTHPLAAAVVSKAAEMNIETAIVKDFRSLTGAGVQGRIGEELFYLGKPKLFEDMGIEPNSETKRLSDEGKTVVLVGTEEKILGLIAIKDAIRPEAKQVVADLHKLGMKVAMLTGDNQRVAHAIAQELNIEDVRAELKPEDKISGIEELATVGIAMGAAGTDAAIEAADTALMGDDLTKVVYAIRLGQKAQTISKQNIVFSLALLAILIPTALFGLITVAIAVIFHEVSELLAVANGLRVTRAIR
jgi:Cd2+/Zn2+-exporting ATPase